MVRPGQRAGTGRRRRRRAARSRKATPTRSCRRSAASRRWRPELRAGVTVVGNGRNWSTSVTGTTNAYFKTNNWQLASGRIFEDAEEKAGAAVCLIGETVRRELFGNTRCSWRAAARQAVLVRGHRRARVQGAGGDGRRPGRHRAAAAAHGAAPCRRQSARVDAAGVDERRQRQRTRDEEPDAAAARAAQAGGRRRRQLQRARHAGRSPKRCPAPRRS